MHKLKNIPMHQSAAPNDPYIPFHCYIIQLSPFLIGTLAY